MGYGISDLINDTGLYEHGTDKKMILRVVQTNVNKPPTDMALSSNLVQDNSIQNTNIATITTVDENMPNDSHTYTIITDIDDKFQISGNLLQVKNAPSIVDVSYDVTLRTTDNAGLFFDKTFTIIVTSDPLPTDLLLSNTSVVDLSLAGTLVAIISTVSGTAPYTYTITSDPDNKFFIQNTNELTLSSSVDRSQFLSHDVNIKVTDNNNFFIIKTFTINIIIKPDYKDEYATQFDGVDDNLQITQNTFFSNLGSAPMTMSFLFKPSRNTGAAMVLMGNASNTGIAASNFRGFELSYNTHATSAANGRLVLWLKNRATIYLRVEKTFLFETTKWYHIAITMDGTKSGVGTKMYIDAVNVAPNIINDNVQLLDCISQSSNLYIATRQNWLPNSLPSFTRINELMFFDKVFNQAEITELENNRIGIDYNTLTTKLNTRHVYRMGDNDTYPTIKDIVGSNDALMVSMNGSEFIKDVVFSTKSIQIDGIDEYLKIPKSVNNNFDGTMPFSVSVWAKIVPDINYINLITNLDIAPVYKGWELAIDNSGNLTFFLISDWPTNNAIHIDGNTGALDNDTWRHLVITYDGSKDANGVQMYVDNVLQIKTVNKNGLTGLTSNNNDLQIGTRVDFPRFVNGIINNLSLWNKALSAQDISDIYGQGAPSNLNYHNEVASIIANYPLGNGDEFPYAKDIKNNNNALMFNMEPSDIIEEAP